MAAVATIVVFVVVVVVIVIIDSVVVVVVVVFVALGVRFNWLSEPVEDWVNIPAYIKFASFADKVSISNAATERMVKRTSPPPHPGMLHHPSITPGAPLRAPK